MSYNIDEVIENVSKGKGLFVDVREEPEWEMGYIEGAKLLALSEIKENPSKVDLPKDKAIYFYCRSGNRTQTALRLLKDDFPNSYSLSEGFEDLVRLNLNISYYE